MLKKELLNTAANTKIQVIYELPDDSAGPFPALILAPGAKYPMTLPVLDDLASEAVRNGVAAFRFDWSYFTADPQNGEASDDLVHERAEMLAVMDFAKSLPQIDPARLILAGKSLGSMVAYPLFQETPDAHALVLLTPVVSREETPVAEEVYPGLPGTDRPVLIAVGDSDPLCLLPQLQQFLAGGSSTVRTVVVPGDHGWCVGPFTDPAYLEANAANIRESARFCAHWIRHLATR